MKVFVSRKILPVLVSAFLSGCGGGFTDMSDGLSNFGTSYSEYDFWKFYSSEEDPPPAPIEASKFPLASHTVKINKGRLSYVDSLRQYKYSFSGVVSGNNISGKVDIIDAYQRNSEEFEGIRVVPVLRTMRYSDVLRSGQPAASYDTSETSYLDSIYGIFVGSENDSKYSVISTESKAVPDLVAAGDTGVTLVYLNYSDSSKSNPTGFSIQSYLVESVTKTSTGDLIARVQTITKHYTQEGELISQGTNVNDLLWDTNGNAGSTNFSSVSEVLSGPGAGRITFTRLR
jgi:hypothetical protein